MALGQKFNKTDVGLYSMAYDELYFTDNMVWLVSKVSNLVALDVPNPKYSNPTSRITIIIKQYILLPRPLELWTTISTIWIFYSALKQNPCEFQNMVMVLFTHQTRVLNFYLDMNLKRFINHALLWFHLEEPCYSLFNSLHLFENIHLEPLHIVVSCI